MAAGAPEVHVKALLASLDKVGASADAITDSAQQLAAPTFAPPASRSSTSPAAPSP